MNSLADKKALLGLKLQHPGSEQGQQAQALEIDLGYQTRNEAPMLRLGSQVAGYRGEIVVNMGLPGSGKSSGVSIVAAAALAKRHGIEIETGSIDIQGGAVLIIDTERTPDNAHKAYTEIFRRLGSSQSVLDGNRIKDLDYLVTSELENPHQQRELLRCFLEKKKYDLVILDGGLDFCDAMNDEEKAADAVRFKRAMAVKYNCLFYVTVHPNKGTEIPAGHYSAFLYRWCRAYLLTRSTNDKNVKEITVDFQHGKLSHGNPAAFVPVFLTWDTTHNMMMPSSAGPMEPSYKVKALKQALFELRQQGFHEVPSAILKENYGRIAGVKEEAAKKHIQDAVRDGLVIPSGKGKATKYLPASNWDIMSKIESGRYAPYIYKGAVPDSTNSNNKYPNDTQINENGYPKDWN